MTMHVKKKSTENGTPSWFCAKGISIQLALPHSDVVDKNTRQEE